MCFGKSFSFYFFSAFSFSSGMQQRKSNGTIWAFAIIGCRFKNGGWRK